jgi:tetratricopeptide (TPR) repeat protein
MMVGTAQNDGPDELTDLGHSLLERYEEYGDTGDLEQAKSAYEQALRVLPAGDDPWTFLNNLGNCLRMSYEAFGDTGDLLRAADVLQTAAGQVQPGTPDAAMVLDNLALVQRNLFAAEGGINRLHEATERHESAVAAGRAGPDGPRYLSNAGGAWMELYHHTGAPTDLDRALACLEESVQATPPGSAELPMRLANLASALADGHERTSEAGLLARALSAARVSVATVRPGALDRPYELSVLAGVLLASFGVHGQLDDLNEAVSALHEAVTATDTRSPAYAGWSNDLCWALLTRFEQTAEEPDLDGAVRAAELATGSITPEAPPGRFLPGLASALGTRYQLRGDRDDLDRAIEVMSAAAEAVPSSDGAPPAANVLHNLALLLLERYAADGDQDDLEASAHWASAAAGQTPDGSPAMARRQAAVGSTQRSWYSATGEPHLLAEAITRCRAAAVAAGTSARATCLNDLGLALLDRYERAGSIDDLQESVDVLRQALEASPDRAVGTAGILSNLGNALWNRHSHNPSGTDLDDALTAFAAAVARTGPRAPIAPTYLDNLANGLTDRYVLAGDPADLTRAVSLYDSALDALPAGSPGRARIWCNLGMTLLTRYRAGRSQSTEDPEDLDRAVAVLTDAVNRTSPASPALAVRLNNLGVALKYQYERQPSAAGLDRAHDVLRRACGAASAGDLRWGMAAALTLAGWATEREQWHEAAGAYRHAMTLAAEYLRAQLVYDSTEAALRQVHLLYPDAAYAFCRAGAVAEAAAAAERGRAILLSQALERDRAAIGDLAGAGREDLAVRFSRASARLRALTAAQGVARA